MQIFQIGKKHLFNQQIVSMKKINLENYGIKNVKEVFHNLSFDALYLHETDPSLEGFEKGYVTDLGAMAVDTGVFTGRSPKDKFAARFISNFCKFTDSDAAIQLAKEGGPVI